MVVLATNWDLTGATQMKQYLINGTTKPNSPKWDILGMILMGGFWIHPFLQDGDDPGEHLPLI